MGLFDKLRGSSTVTFNPQQALITIVVATVKADGHVSDDEIARIRSLCLLNPLFSSNSTEQDSALLRSACRRSRWPRRHFRRHCGRRRSRMPVTWCSPMASSPKTRIIRSRISRRSFEFPRNWRMRLSQRRSCAIAVTNR